MLENIHENEVLPRGPEDAIIPSRVSTIDRKIAELREEAARIQCAIGELTLDRAMLLIRAKEVGVTEDAYCKILYIPIYPNRKVDAAVFKAIAPDKFDLACRNVLAKIEDKFKAEKERVGISFTHADVKALISDRAILARVIPEPTTPSGYEVSVVKK